MNYNELIAEKKTQLNSPLLINAIEAKERFLKNTGTSNEIAQLTVLEELEKMVNTVSDSVTAGNATELVPESVQLSTMIDLAVKNPRYAFIAGLSQWAQTAQSRSNKYPILGDYNSARWAVEWDTGTGLYDNKEGVNTFNSARATIDLKKYYDSYGISDELSIYSTVDALSIARGRIDGAIMQAIAEWIINGDSRSSATSDPTLNINWFGADPIVAGAAEFPAGALDARLWQDNGLRKAAIEAGNTEDIGTPSWADDFFEVAKKLSFGGNPAERIIICDNSTYYEYMKDDDFKDQSANGRNSTITTGAITNIAGMDLFVTDLIRLSSSDGKVDGVTPANNTKGSFIITQRNTIQHSMFGNIRYQILEDIQRGVLLQWVTYFGFDNIDGRVTDFTGAYKVMVAMGINITV